MKKTSLLAILGGAIGGALVACILLFAPVLPAADGDTSIYGRFIVQSTAYTAPTCTGASGVGDICAGDDITVTDALTVGGATALTGDVTVNTNKFVVTASSGNATSAGTIQSAGLVTTTLEADLAAGACTAGTWKVDNGGATRELCRCNDGATAYDCISVTTANGPTN